jgi:nucleoside-diphosphate-sugar epimerase
MLPGADQHLTVINGDVTNAASLQAAMVGCEQLVHLAAVVDIKPPTDDQHKQQMISTALEGTRIVLSKFCPAPSVLLYSSS